MIFISSPLYAGYDYISICALGLTVHPDNQGDLAQYYPRKLDHDADFILTPGIVVNYDRYVEEGTFHSLRITGSYFSDCADMPAGYIGAGGLMDLVKSDYFSMQFCLGAGLYMRENWERKLDDKYSSILFKSGAVEWIVLPFPELELQFHPEDDRVQLVVDIMSLIYVSMIDAGIRMRY